MNRDLAKFNAMVAEWAAEQPKKYRKTARAFGYRCDKKTHSFSGTLRWISQQSRKRSGEGVSRATLERHLKVFEKHGVITVERRRNGDKNMSSVYTVHFDRFIADDDSAAFFASLISLAPNEITGGHDKWLPIACKTCGPLIESGQYTEDELFDIHEAGRIA